MSGMGVGLLVEEHRAEIHQTWTSMVETELPGERALEFAVGPLLRELSMALRGDAHRPTAPRPDPLARCAVLVRAAGTPARVAREFKLLHRAVWDTLRRAGHIVALGERRNADEWLDDALAAALERTDRVRMRIDLLERGPQVIPAAPARPRPAASTGSSRQRPPPLPWNRPRSAPPPEPPITLIE